MAILKSDLSQRDFKPATSVLDRLHFRVADFTVLIIKLFNKLSSASISGLSAGGGVTNGDLNGIIRSARFWLYTNISIQYSIDAVIELAEEHWDELDTFGLTLVDLQKIMELVFGKA